MKQVLGVVISMTLLAGCATTTGTEQSRPILDDGIAELEAMVDAQQKTAVVAPPPPPPVVPPLAINDLTSAEVKFDVAADNVDAHSFFMGLVQGTDYNMIVHPDIDGTVNLKLKRVTVEQVMQAMQKVYGYEYSRDGNLFQVIPASIQTKVFHLNYLDVERDGSSDTQVSSGSVSDTVSGASDSSGSSDTGTTSSSSTVGTRISTRSSTNFWGNLEKTLTALVTGEDRAVVISPHTGMVIVRGLPSELAIVEDYLQQAELILHRQVVLEAKILEITLSEAFRTGVNWTALSTNGSGETFSIEQVADSIASTGLGGIFRTSANINDFTAVIELLGRQGDVQVLSSPRVSTINNQKAVIKVGNDEYFVTEVETTTTTGDTTTTTPSIEFTPFFSGIALDVTPQISGDGDIVLHIHPTVSDVVDQQKDINIGTEDYSIPLAFSSIRESDSIVRAESGQIIVIGGLMKSESDKDREGVSGLQDVPLFGNLFKQRSETSEKTELVILLRPVLATDDVWQDELRRSLDTMREMRSESEQRKR